MQTLHLQGFKVVGVAVGSVLTAHDGTHDVTPEVLLVAPWHRARSNL